jgi:hypothetical protein
MPVRAKRLLGSYVVACAIVGATVLVAAATGDWPWAIVWSVWIALMVLRDRFFPDARGRQLHPPNESTLRFLRRRRRGAQ